MIDLVFGINSTPHSSMKPKIEIGTSQLHTRHRTNNTNNNNNNIPQFNSHDQLTDLRSKRQSRISYLNTIDRQIGSITSVGGVFVLICLYFVSIFFGLGLGDQSQSFHCLKKPRWNKIRRLDRVQNRMVECHVRERGS